MSGDRGGRPSTLRTLAALLLFGLAFGYVEGAVVVTLRGVYDPIHARLRPDRAADDLFTLDPARGISVTKTRLTPGDFGWEVVREEATLVMLAAVPWTFARNFREWIAGFMVGFGVWDLAYYATLKTWLGWPPSLLTWDILFLLPLPWSGPILAPVLVSASIIGAGVILLCSAEEGEPRPIPLGPWHWALDRPGRMHRDRLVLLGGPIRSLGGDAKLLPLGRLRLRGEGSAWPLSARPAWPKSVDRRS